MNVILAEETSFGLRMMADATDTHTLWVLIRVRQWHVEREAYDRALARVVEAQAGLPIHGHSGFERRPVICRHSARRCPGKREIRQDARPLARPTARSRIDTGRRSVCRPRRSDA